QIECFESAVLFARSEGILPAPEASHAISEVVRQAVLARESGQEKVILFNLCGHGHFDLMAYEQFMSGQLKNHSISDEEIKKSILKSEGF
ncbi:hypothetical protein RZS08_64320, partial [Arthrospira platensis SPKY1]|nr:hypothetical protein [Arthrospira platensis SPKY1]